ncbi:hypothetical protein QTP70_003145 [Hemibagrus guttatus]|uniref:Reverse transcriptase domain-containing protein n=1 Tax=Hemibagrus guttatus TaxID=175788 RepID=A0AAE0UX85_9TELE|nr:hypothetical protein QTP70_003145 [Hemibagrus guttatus]
MYERSRTVVRCAVGQTEEFKVEVGLHQGSALSPFLFAIVMDQLSEENYIDSLSFLTMKLSSLPKAMGFSEKKKGYFPHFWNILEHQNYIDPYPEPKFYGMDSMMPKDRFNNLFTDYIKMFLKTKQESSGYPSWVVDETAKNTYIQNYQ